MMTPWFDKYTRPHLVGVYETRINGTSNYLAYNYWNGTHWEPTTPEPIRLDAYFFNGQFTRTPSKVQNIEWRGFNKEQQ